MNNFLANTTLGGGHGTDNEVLISTAANIVQIVFLFSTRIIRFSLVLLKSTIEPLETGDTRPRN